MSVRVSVCVVAVLVSSWSGVASGQTMLSASDADFLGEPMDGFYTAAEQEQKAGLSDMEVYQGILHFSYGGTNNNIPHKFLFYDIAANSFGQALGEDGEPFTTREEGMESLRIFDDGIYFAGYDPFGGSPTKHVRMRADGTWEQLVVSRDDSHSRDIYKFDGVLFSSFGRVAAPWPKIQISEDNGSSWTLLDQSDESDGDYPPLYFEFFEFDGVLYATGLDTEGVKEGENTVSVVSNEPWMVALDAGTRPVKFRAAFQSITDFIPTLSPDPQFKSSYIIRDAVEIDGRLVFAAGTTLMYVAESVEPPQVTELNLPAGALVRTITRQNDTLWRFLTLPNGYRVDASYNGVDWEPLFTLPRGIRPPGWSNDVRFREMAVDENEHIYLSGSGDRTLALYKIDASKYQKSPRPSPPDMGMVEPDMAMPMDMAPAMDMAAPTSDMGGVMPDMRGGDVPDMPGTSQPQDMAASTVDMGAGMEPAPGDPGQTDEGCAVAPAGRGPAPGSLLVLGLFGLCVGWRRVRRRDHLA